MGLLDQKYSIVNNNDKAIQINKPYSDHTSMLGGAKGKHWHLLIFFSGCIFTEIIFMKVLVKIRSPGQSLFHWKLVNFHEW
jgi:hypothetical protein